MTSVNGKSMTVDEIKAPIKNEMAEFELKFKASMKSSVPLLDKITAYIVKRKGKQLRPMFVFLSAKHQVVYKTRNERILKFGVRKEIAFFCFFFSHILWDYTDFKKDYSAVFICVIFLVFVIDVIIL